MRLPDWAEACVGPHFLPCIPTQNTWGGCDWKIFARAAMLSSIRKELGADFSHEAVSAAMDLAPFLAVFAYAAGTGSWRNPTVLSDPKAAAYLRV